MPLPEGGSGGRAPPRCGSPREGGWRLGRADRGGGPAQEPITGVVLAGGTGRRMGGCDKGLVPLDGRPLVAHVLERLAPQVAAVRINANRHRDRYAALGVPVDGDHHPGQLGPLAGMASALAHAATARVLTVPCDAPLLPAVTAQRLAAALAASGAEIAIARAHGRRQPVFALMRRAVYPELEAALAAGVRRVEDWLACRAVAEADFEDLADGLVNVNTPAELAALADPRQRRPAGGSRR